MVVYRIEHDVERYGPYNIPVVKDGAQRAMIHRHDRTETRRPIPWQRTRDWRFGFSSIKSLCRWFTANDRRMLGTRGYVIRTYRDPDIVYDDGLQVAFTLDTDHGQEIYKLLRTNRTGRRSI